MILHKQSPVIGVVIPAFNEARTISSIVDGAKQHASFVIVVDDGSGDRTAEKARKAGADVIVHQQNKGYDASIEDGFREMTQRGADIIVTMDGDGQHDPSDIETVIKPIKEERAHVVVGERKEIPHGAEKLFSLYARVRFGIRDPLCGLKAYQKTVYKKAGHFDSMNSIGTQLALESIRRGFTVISLPIHVKAREGTTSRFFFNNVKGNIKILRALFKIILFLR